MWGRRRPSARRAAGAGRGLADGRLGLGTGGSGRPRYEPHGGGAVRRVPRQVPGVHRAWTEAAFPAGTAGGAALPRGAGSTLAPGPVSLTRCSEQGIRRDSLRPLRRAFANVIRRPDGRIGLVDWEDSGLGDPARDIVGSVSHPEPGGSARAGGVAGVPGAVPGGAGAARSDCCLGGSSCTGRSTRCSGCPCCSRRGFGRAAGRHVGGWTINGLPANVRLRRYLARALAWPDQDFSRQTRRAGRTGALPEVHGGGVELPRAPGAKAPSGPVDVTAKCSRFVAEWALQAGAA